MRRVVIAGGWVFFSPNSWLFQFKNTLPLIMGRRGKEASTTRDPISPCRNCCVWYLVHIWTECLGNPWWVLCIVLSRRPRAERRDEEMPKPDERGEEAGKWESLAAKRQHTMNNPSFLRRTWKTPLHRVSCAWSHQFCSVGYVMLMGTIITFDY